MTDKEESVKSAVAATNKIYILELADKCYYVGKTSYHLVDSVMKEHMDGNMMCEWTRLHRPIRLIREFDETSCDLEDITTERLMREHSVLTVRGGIYSEVTLPQHQLQVLSEKSCSVKDQCLECNSTEHTHTKCPSSSKTSSPNLQKRPRLEVTVENACERCGFDTHTIDICHETVNIDGYELSDTMSSDECGDDEDDEEEEEEEEEKDEKDKNNAEENVEKVIKPSSPLSEKDVKLDEDELEGYDTDALKDWLSEDGC